MSSSVAWREVGHKLRATPVVTVDRVQFHSDREVVVAKTVGTNEPYLEGHYPGMPVYPGAFLVDSACDAAALLYAERHGCDLDLDTLVSVRFTRALRPGDTVLIHCEATPDEIDPDRIAFSVWCEHESTGDAVARIRLIFRRQGPTR